LARRIMRRRRHTAPSPPPREGVEPYLRLDSALKGRLRAAVESERPPAEHEVRRLAEEGRACSLMLGAVLERGEERLRDLDADPASPIVELAGTFRDVSALRRDLGELDSLLVDLQERARAGRAAWLTASARSASR
jgi:hypothetical protein